MIEVVYRKKEQLLTVKGHAGAGIYGADPVCAAVSILVYTLGENLCALDRKQQLDGCTVHLSGGAAVLSARPKRLWRRKTDRVFRTVCRGFRLLDAEYPAYVRYEEK